jgi:pyridoxamine 5'-phosphate oxidase
MTLLGNTELINTSFEDPQSNPMILLQKWLDAAEEIGINESKGFVLSTVNSNGIPSSRVVLLKELDQTGIIFTSKDDGIKGKDLTLNPWVAGNFWWHETIQQISLQGIVNKLSTNKSDELFYERTRDKQAVAVLSKQSQLLIDEAELRNKVKRLIHSSDEIIRPKNWHAYHLAIQSIEFWIGYKNRFHQRLRYDLKSGYWNYKRLQP